jgi:hypothetical protein
MANKILLSKAAFVLWKRRILCAFPGTWRGIWRLLQGNALDEREHEDRVDQCNRDVSTATPSQASDALARASELEPRSTHYEMYDR